MKLLFGTSTLLGMVLGLVFFAAPAVAQGGLTKLDLCLSRSLDQEQDRDCQFIVYEDCEAAMDSMSTDVLAGCLARETAAWDAQLNREWATVRAQAEAQDAQDAGADGAHTAALLAAQRAWIGYRDAECANTYQRYIGGTIRSLMAGSCLAEMTAERVIAFRDWQREQ